MLFSIIPDTTFGQGLKPLYKGYSQCIQRPERGWVNTLSKVNLKPQNKNNHVIFSLKKKKHPLAATSAKNQLAQVYLKDISND